MNIKEAYQDAKDTGAEVTLTYKKAVTWLLDPNNKDVIISKLEKNESLESPDYYGIPNSISEQFTLDEADLLKDFSTELKKYYKINQKVVSKVTLWIGYK